MKKYLVLFFLFFLTVSPISAKNNENEQVNQITISPNENQIKTQNEGDNQQLTISTQENEQLNETEVSEKVYSQTNILVQSMGTKNAVGEQITKMAQTQEENQNQIKEQLKELNSRNQFVKFLFGSDKEVVTSLSESIKTNESMIKLLEDFKSETSTNEELKQIQNTIDLLSYQNSSLLNKIKETKSNGIFSWLKNFFGKE